MSVRRFSWLFVAGFCLTAACARGRQLQGGGLAGNGAPTMKVQNDNWLDVVIYIVRGAARFRVGTVGGNSSQTFSLSAAHDLGSSPLRIMADPIGSNNRYLTEPILLGPGQLLEVKVGSPISISSFAVWNR